MRTKSIYVFAMCCVVQSVYVNTRGSFLKFVIKQNHLSTQNLFNQVSLIAIRVVGAPAASAAAPSGYGVGGAAAHAAAVPSAVGVDSDLAVELAVDARTAQALRELNARKELAVRREEYELAKQIKLEMMQLKKVNHMPLASALLAFCKPVLMVVCVLLCV
jgi:hypothetical protein